MADALPISDVADSRRGSRKNSNGRNSAGKRASIQFVKDEEVTHSLPLKDDPAKFEFSILQYGLYIITTYYKIILLHIVTKPYSHQANDVAANSVRLLCLISFAC